ncbi:hypothetical protein BHE74_00044141 [Ensete ventricosum]|nr:hypothetical protein BHE74_00044141 [Ensete ventricosum]
MKSYHNFDSTMSLESLAMIRERYNIPTKYVLHAPAPGQHPYHSCPGGFSISIDALEAELRFPLHLVIGECLGWWWISPSQVAPNSWRYIITFLGECRGARIVPTQDLFLSCFQLCKGQGIYYLIAWAGLRVAGAPSNNKGWKTWFLFVSRRPGWEFGVELSAHPINNVPPNLSDEDSILVEWLKGILFASQVIRNLIEQCPVETGLNPSFQGMCQYGEHGLTVWPFEGRWRTLWCHRPKCRRAIPDFYSCPAEPNVVPSPSEVQEIPLEEVTQKVPESSGKRPAETSSG